MLLRICVVVLGAVYVVYRLSLSVRIVRASRRGDAEREQELRRQAFWTLRGVVLIALLGFLVLFTLLGFSHH